MSAAIAAAHNGNNTVLLEKNEKIGKKLYITGKGRCNVTNNCDFFEFVDNVVSNKKFLYSALRGYGSEEAINDIEATGIKLKTERGNRVFPVSDKSSDILKAFERMLLSAGVVVKLGEEVKNLTVDNGNIVAINTNKNSYTDITAVVVATGGISYSATGSTGDGYRFAKKCGHTIVPPVPALTGIYVRDLLCFDNTVIPYNRLPKIQGISLKNVTLSIWQEARVVYSAFGEMLFTDKGISGPITLSASSNINRLDFGKLRLSIDFKPALSEETLDARLLRDFGGNNNKSLKNVLIGLLPSGLVPIILAATKIDGSKQTNETTKGERQLIIKALKGLVFLPEALEPIDRAVVTAGGISVNDIDPKTMKSKIINNMYFAGEVMDIDAYTGGYNIQLAMSTGHCAGSHIYTEE